MAKYDEREGNSCHIHLSLRGTDGDAGVLGRGRAATGRRSTTSSSPGVLATTADFTLLYAPNINSYKRFADALLRARPRSRGAWTTAPARSAWSARGAAARMENRIPGADVNPYLALAAMLAGGLHGIENELELEDELVGNAYTSGAAAGALDACAAAREAFATSKAAREALGDEVVDHYVNMADVELAAFDAAVTDWELRRGFERLLNA